MWYLCMLTLTYRMESLRTSLFHNDFDNLEKLLVIFIVGGSSKEESEIEKAKEIKTI